LLRRRLERRGLAVSLATIIACLSGQAMAAPLPSDLVDSTVQATIPFVAGTATPSCSSAQAVALAKSEVHCMFVSQLKVVSSVLVPTGLTAWGGLGAYQAWAEKPSDAHSPLAALQSAPQAAPEAFVTAAAEQDAAKAKSLEGRWTAKLDIGDKSI